MTDDTVSTEEVLAEVAAATADLPKKVRQAKHDPDGQLLEMPKKERKPKAPKLYPQFAEDGTPLLNEDGTPVMGETKPPKKEKAPKAPRVDADGNPLPRKERTVMLDTQELIVTPAGLEASAKFREGTKRHTNFAAITPGITVGEYFEATGGRRETGTFLVWYISQGYVELGGTAE